MVHKAIIIFSGIIGVFVGYLFGFSKGEVSLSARSDLIRPSLKDLQIEGFYRIKNGDLDEIYQRLLGNIPLIQLQHDIAKFGNRIIFLHKDFPRGKKEYLKYLGNIRPGVIYDLRLLFSPIENGFNIETICRPIIYMQISQNVQFDFLHTHVEDAQESCILFTREVMNSLNTEVVKQPSISKEKDKPELTFYSNTTKTSNINLKAESMIVGVKYEIMYCGWIDRTFLGLLEKAQDKGVKIRIVTKDPSGSSRLVKTDFKRLKVSFKDNVRTNSFVHDRFVICDDSVLLGSMYLTDASKTRYESEIFTEDSSVVDGVKQHFEMIWNDANSNPLK